MTWKTRGVGIDQYYENLQKLIDALNLIKDQSFLAHNPDLNYITIHINTRYNLFSITDEEGNPIHPQRIVEVAERFKADSVNEGRFQ